MKSINFKLSEGLPRQDSFKEILLSKIGPSIQELWANGLTNDQNLNLDGFWRFMQNPILQHIYFKLSDGSHLQRSYIEILPSNTGPSVQEL